MIELFNGIHLTMLSQQDYYSKEIISDVGIDNIAK